MITNSKKDKVEKTKKNSHNNFNIILPNDKIEILPIYMNTNTATNLNYNKINNSCDGLNNIKGNNRFKKVNINSTKTSNNNTNREILNFRNNKNRKKRNVNNIEKKKDDYNDYHNDENNPEMYFFNIIKMIQRSKNNIL